MKSARIVYLIYVMALACAHMIVALAFWGTPALVTGGETIKVACFVALFGGWILAGVSDLALSAYDMLPLTFAGEAALANASLAILAVLNAGVFYMLCTFIAPLLVMSKGIEELVHNHQGMKHA